MFTRNSGLGATNQADPFFSFVPAGMFSWKTAQAGAAYHQLLMDWVSRVGIDQQMTEADRQIIQGQLDQIDAQTIAQQQQQATQAAAAAAAQAQQAAQAAVALQAQQNAQQQAAAQKAAQDAAAAQAQQAAQLKAQQDAAAAAYAQAQAAAQKAAQDAAAAQASKDAAALQAAQQAAANAAAAAAAAAASHQSASQQLNDLHTSVGGTGTSGDLIPTGGGDFSFVPTGDMTGATNGGWGSNTGIVGPSGTSDNHTSWYIAGAVLAAVLFLRKKKHA